MFDELESRVSEKGNIPTVDWVVGNILKHGCFENSDVLAEWTDDEIHLFGYSLEREGVSPEEVGEIISHFDAITFMYAVAAELWWSEGASNEGDYWKKILEILAKYSSLFTEVLGKLAKDCKYYDEDHEHFGGDEAPKAILLCTHPRNNPCPRQIDGNCCALCYEDCPYVCSNFEGVLKLGVHEHSHRRRY